MPVKSAGNVPIEGRFKGRKFSEITKKMFYKVSFLEEESPVVLLCYNCAFKLPTYQEIDWSRSGDVQNSEIEELPFYELVNRKFTCPAKNCVKILNFQEFKEKNCCEGATNPLLAWI